MNRMKMFAFAMSILCVNVALTVSGAMAQGMSKIDKSKLVGGWTLVSATVTQPDGKKLQNFGPNEGALVFEANGKFVQVLAVSGLPKFASNNRSTGTADENKMVVQKSLAFFGTYTISDDGTLTLHIERGTFPNWNGTDQKRAITSLTADELKYGNSASTIGGSAELVWKRNK